MQVALDGVGTGAGAPGVIDRVFHRAAGRAGARRAQNSTGISASASTPPPSEQRAEVRDGHDEPRRHPAACADSATRTSMVPWVRGRFSGDGRVDDQRRARDQPKFRPTAIGVSPIVPARGVTECERRT